MKTIGKYIISGIIIALLTYKFLLSFLTTDHLLRGIAFIGAYIIFTVIICTGIIVQNIHRAKKHDADDPPSDNSDFS